MVMEPFHVLFPEVGHRETRSVEVVRDGDLVPKGKYGFVEAYCTEPGCDCENVMLNVFRLGEKDKASQAATINFDIADDETSRFGHPRAFLDPLNPQGPHADGILRLFREVLMADQNYVARLARHRRMVRQLVEATASVGIGPVDDSD